MFQSEAAKIWGPRWLPPGFSRVVHSMNAQMPTAMDRIQTYSDGISAFSLFLDRVKDKKMPDMDQRWGATSAVVRHTGKRDDKMRVTVVGEIPMKTARSVAKSVYISDN
ncbi:MAG: MucB/RseB C-terminal domain-containing protein, partial [Oceanobacter sp.]